MRWRKGRTRGQTWSPENEILDDGHWCVEAVGEEVLVRFGGKRAETRYSLTPAQARELAEALNELSSPAGG